MDMSGQPKTRNRAAVYLMAQVAGATDLPPGRYVVRNLSATGACIAAERGIEQGQQLTVSLGLLDHVAAEVAWARGGLAGLRFLEPIDVAEARRRKPPEGSAHPGWIDRPDVYRVKRKA